MYKIEFYETQDGESQICGFLEDLRKKAATSKDARIQHKQASLYIELLQQNGTRLNENIAKYLGTTARQQSGILLFLPRQHLRSAPSIP